MNPENTDLILVEIDLYDENISGIFTLRLSNKRAVFNINGTWLQYEPRLIPPIQIGSKVSAEQYGSKLRGAPNGGNIDIAIDEGFYPYISFNRYHWLGRVFRIYEGQSDSDYSSMVMVYSGNVGSAISDVENSKFTIQTTDASLNLNIPLIPGLYQAVPSVLDIELLTGVLEKTISGDTNLTLIESTSPGVNFTGNLLAPANITWASGFTGIVQIENNTSGGFGIICFAGNGPGFVIANGTGQALFCIGNGFVLADNSLAQTTPANLIGLPKPRLWGQVVSLQPTLEVDDIVQIWRISTTPLAEVTSVSVGGIPWQEVESSPGPGQWMVDLENGLLYLGSVTLGYDVTVNAKAVGWESLNTAELLRELVEMQRQPVTSIGFTVDEDSFTQFASDAPQLVGFYTTTSPVNCLDAFDTITANVAGWWEFGPSGNLRAGVIEDPDPNNVTLSLDKININTMQLNSLVPPGWRIRIQFAPNWQPLSNALPGITEAEAFLQAAPGLVTEPFDDQGILVLEPRAVDVPIINSFVLINSDAVAIRDRVSVAWGTYRNLYDITYFGDLPQIYDTIEIDYLMVSGNFRVHSIVRSIGGSYHTLQVWG